jgi:hypothetical protein
VVGEQGLRRPSVAWFDLVKDEANRFHDAGIFVDFIA